MAEKRLTRAKLIRWAKAHWACEEGLAAFERTKGEPIDVLKRWSRNAGATRDHFWWVRSCATWDARPTREQQQDLFYWIRGGPPAWDVLERVILADLARIEESRRG